jgi:pimeloyl-ACP methyl ester carboxylesterase
MLPDGRYYGSGEKNIFARISGKGNPVVVIEPGWGNLSLEWWQIQEELSKFTTVITYDRAGYAESPPSSTPRTSTNIVMELFNMLCNTTLPSPYIIIGHSLGGLYAQHFSKLFPRQTAGLILVDSITTNLLDFDKLDAPNFQKYGSYKSRAENIRKLLELNNEDYTNTITPMLNGLYSDFPRLIADQLFIYQIEKSFCKTITDEYDGIEESIKMLNAIPIFPDIPVYVLCRDFNIMTKISETIGIPFDEARAVEELWVKHNKELLNLSPKSEFFFIKNSSHNIHLTRPDAIIEAVKTMINKIT